MSRAITENEYREIIETIEKGFLTHRPNHKVATALVLEANLGIRISDILLLKLEDIVFECGRYHLDITEKKTKKVRTFTVPLEVVEYIRQYCKMYEIKENESLFKFTERQVQKHLKAVCDFLELEDVSSHSFRKFFATSIYVNNDYNIVLVQKILQHSSPSTTQRYIGISTQDIEKALNNHICL